MKLPVVISRIWRFTSLILQKSCMFWKGGMARSLTWRAQDRQRSCRGLFYFLLSSGQVSSHFCASFFFLLKHMNSNSTPLRGLLWELNELRVKCNMLTTVQVQTFQPLIFQCFYNYLWNNNKFLKRRICLEYPWINSFLPVLSEFQFQVSSLGWLPVV